MLRTYICAICWGRGTVWTVDYGEGGETTEPCPYCAANGAPPKIEIPIKGPPAAKEYIVDVEYTPIGTPIIKGGE